MKFKLKLALLVTLLFCSILSLYILFKEDRSGILTVAFLNIGQGDAILIDSPSGNQLLIDGGPGRSVLRELGAVLPFYDRSIDVVLTTHPDADHIGGIPDVLGKYTAKIFIEPGVEAETSIYKELERLVVEKESKNNGKIKKIEARKGMVLNLGGGATLEILFPVFDPRGMETNTASIVAQLVYGENEFLLTGDSPTSIENYLVSLEDAHQGKLKSDVLKAGHHGSRTSTSPNFISAVSPKHVVISAGKDNKYGHPHQEVLDTINNFGAQILRTDQQGRIVFESDGVNLKVK